MSDSQEFGLLLDEADEHLEAISSALLEMEGCFSPPGRLPEQPVLDRIMRALHSLKSACSVFPELAALSKVVHSVESFFVRIQAGDFPITTVVFEILSEAVDEINQALIRMRKAAAPVECDFLGILQDKLDILLFMSEEETPAASTPAASTPAASAPAAPPVQEVFVPVPPPESAVSSDWNPEDFEEMLPDFVTEATEILETFANDLVTLENDRENTELINRIFRSAHTMKGSSGMMGLKVLEQLTHKMENRLDAIRKGRESLTPVLMDALLLCIDSLKEMVGSIAKRQPVFPDIQPLLSLLMEEAPPSSASGEATSASPPETVMAEEVTARPPAPAPTRIGDAPPKEVSSDKPAEAAEGIIPTLRVGIDKLDKVMNLVGELAITKIGFDQKLQSLDEKMEAIFRSRKFGMSSRSDRRGGGAGVGAGGGGSSVSESARDSREDASDVEQMTALLQSSERITALMSELQESVMKTRMVPVAQVFNKFPRTIRDLSRLTGKKMELIIEGAETELDKTVVEKIGDPLMHLIRNAADHGIESAEKRVANGKSETGLVKLKASQVGDHIMIEIEDDGAGIDPVKMRESAVKKGLLTPEAAAAMNDQQALNIIFLAGFSTAVKVTDLSGRGVGMDVVRDNIESLKGALEIRSVVGQGSAIRIKLPLTLAIIQVLIIRCAEQTLAIPISSIEESLYCRPEEIRRVGMNEVINVRGVTLPLCWLETILGLKASRGAGGSSTAERRQFSSTHDRMLSVIVVAYAGTRIGLIVDQQVRKQEVVIKNLGSLLSKVRYAAGSTILGDGRVILILDVAEVVKGASSAQQAGGRSVIAEQLVNKEKRILVVEDSNVVRRRIAGILREGGFQVDEAVNGKDGLDKAKREPYDLVTVDIMMPVMDGYELARRLREEQRYRTVPIIVISSRSDDIDKRRGFEAGIDDYITKPFAEAQILTTVRKLIR